MNDHAMWHLKMHIVVYYMCFIIIVGDEQPSSEDVLSESADETPVADSETAHVHVSDVDSPGHNVHESHEQVCAEAETLKQDSSKGTMSCICTFSPLLLLASQYRLCVYMHVCMLG